MPTGLIEGFGFSHNKLSFTVTQSFPFYQDYNTRSDWFILVKANETFQANCAQIYISDLIVQNENTFQLSHLKQKIRPNIDIESSSWSWMP